MARVEASLKSLVMERGLDLGDHLGWMWLTGIRKCLESDCYGANSANKMVLPVVTAVMLTATAVASMLVGGLG